MFEIAVSHSGYIQQRHTYTHSCQCWVSCSWNRGCHVDPLSKQIWSRTWRHNQSPYQFCFLPAFYLFIVFFYDDKKKKKTVSHLYFHSFPSVLHCKSWQIDVVVFPYNRSKKAAGLLRDATAGTGRKCFWGDWNLPLGWHVSRNPDPHSLALTGILVTIGA